MVDWTRVSYVKWRLRDGTKSRLSGRFDTKEKISCKADSQVNGRTGVQPSETEMLLENPTWKWEGGRESWNLDTWGEVSLRC